MLYNPKWQQPDKVYQGVSLRELIAWLETMPANEQYEFMFAGICAIARFLESKGASPEDRVVDFGAGLTPDDDSYWLGLRPGDEGYWLLQIVSNRPYTFGAALERARTAASGAEVIQIFE